MDQSQFVPFAVLLPLLLFLFMLIKLYLFASDDNPTPKLPPGPPKIPVIGNLHQLSSFLPHRTLGDLAKAHGPLMHLKLGEVSTIVVSSAEIAREVMKSHDITFAQRPTFLASKILSYDNKDISFAPYGNYWGHMRKICLMDLFSPARIQSFQKAREEQASELIRIINLNQGSSINLSKEILSSTYSIISRIAFGKRCKDCDEFPKIFRELTKLLSGFCVADFYPSIDLLQHIGGTRGKLERVQQEADRVLQKIINEHKTRRNTAITEVGVEEDLVDVLLKIQEQSDPEFSLTDNSIKAVLLDIFIAGIETSSTTVEWAMSEILKSPRVMKEVQTEVRLVFDGKGNVDDARIPELVFLKCVIKETLRLHPPLPLLLPRESNKSCEILGYEIPEKTRLLVNVWMIGRDPKQWPKAKKFYPERFFGNSIDYWGTNPEFMPFGAGKRVCPGVSCALANIELPLAQLLYHFDWSLPNGLKNQDLDMSEATGLTLRRKEDLILIPSRYLH